MRSFSKKPVVAALVLIVGALLLSVLLPPPNDSDEEAGQPGEDVAPAPVPAAAKTRASLPEAESSEAGGEFDVVFFAPWGSGKGRLGRRVAEESDPEGPMGFVVDEAGRAAVLDQVNSRVVLFKDGRQIREIGLPADTYQDFQLGEDGKLVLMDRLAHRSVDLFDPQGKRIARIDLEGVGVPEGGGTTALFLRDDGVWVEVEHTRLVRVADARGRPDPKRPQVNGRFSADGAWLISAAKEGRQSAVVLVRPVDSPGDLPRLLSRVDFSLPVLHLLALESDTAGRVLLAAHLARFGEQAPFGVLEERVEAVLLGPDGREVDRLRLEAPRGALDQFRTLRFSSDGILYHLYYDESGVSLRRVVL
jgi:hypothetical protein